jgi:hypothetical protein
LTNKNDKEGQEEMKQLILSLLICFCVNTYAMPPNSPDNPDSAIPIIRVHNPQNDPALNWLNEYMNTANKHLNESQRRELALIAAGIDSNFKHPLNYHFWKFVRRVSDPISQLSMLACAVIPMIALKDNEKANKVLSFSTTMCAIASLVLGKIHGYAENALAAYEYSLLCKRVIELNETNMPHLEEEAETIDREIEVFQNPLIYDKYRNRSS